MISVTRNLATPLALAAIAFLASTGFAQNPANGKNILNVQTYGAAGDGVTDDRPAIQAALNDAHKLGNATVYFGPGVYYLATSTSSNGQLSVSDWSGVYSIDLLGDGATLLTQQASGSILFAEGYWQNATVQGLTFASTHPITASSTAAIVFSGGGQNAIQNWTIKNNTFQNFSRHIAVSGVTGLQISNNRFLMTAGRDSGTALDPEPNVGIWLFNNTPNGTSQNVQILENYFNGCTGGDVSATVSQSCADGLVLGQGSAITVRGNHIKGFSFEGIYLQPDQTFGAPSTIVDNLVDGTLVKGDINGGGQWGIRCDANGTQVLQNTVTNALNGIVIYGAQLPADVQNETIQGNTVVVTAATTQNVQTGIQVVGASNTTVSGNTLILASTAPAANEISLIYLSGLVGRYSSGLTVTGNNIVSSTQAYATGIYLQWTCEWNVAANTIQGATNGFHLMNLSGAVALIDSLIQQNALQGNSASAQISNGWFQ
jgi:hypothetical protein